MHITIHKQVGSLGFGGREATMLWIDDLDNPIRKSSVIEKSSIPLRRALKEAEEK
jgi:hypothetical protein